MFYKKRMQEVERQLEYLRRELERLDTRQEDRDCRARRSNDIGGNTVRYLEERMNKLCGSIPAVAEIEESVDGTTLKEISRVSHDVDLKTAVIAILEHLDLEVVVIDTNKTRCEERH